MLPVLVRLEKLDLMILDDLPYLERIFARISSKQKPFDTRPALTALTDVVHMGYHNKRGMRATYFSRFFQLPAIQAVYGHRVATYGENQLSSEGS